ncbi:hypothetical protein K1T71_010363 [Dendrolimus kikuchii]|uniref:Uncharacterized protein n=1 Tax=Dendrolimus kikuchii TaxID=765133 RepID=A0ACC1CSF5_9NEOP|nr:hypothetical protein K1T71_010363 [Dendrolimus kikuchii]
MSPYHHFKDMELVSFAQEVLQTIAEHAASYKVGQIGLRYLDRALRVVEKCARWAVPPPLDQDERPQPELVRPLPWVFFLMMLITLRVTRESISIVNLIMGKPPLRSADVVMYIQSKRRYLRTLTYQGNRIARARRTTNAQPRNSWYSTVRSLFEFTMCFRKPSQLYGNNNTTNVSNNDEVLVVKHGKPERESNSPVALGNAESTMERLIEKMMVDLDADSDEDSCFTITTITTPKSERSESAVESDHETDLNIDSTPAKSTEMAKPKDTESSTEKKSVTTSTPEKKGLNVEEITTDIPTVKGDIDKQKVDDDKDKIANKTQNVDNDESKVDNEVQRVDKEKVSNETQKVDNDTKKIDEKASTIETPKREIETPAKDTKVNSTPDHKINPQDNKIYTKHSDESPKSSTIPIKHNTDKRQINTAEENTLTWEKVTVTSSTKEESMNFLQHERSQQRSSRAPKNDYKMANGRTVKSVPNKKKGAQTERREVIATKSSPGNNSL